MARYSIEDTSLIAIGDSLRGHLGETKENIVSVEYVMETKVYKSPNAQSLTSGQGEDKTNNAWFGEVLTFPGATSLKVKCGYAVNYYSRIFIVGNGTTAWVDNYARYYNGMNGMIEYGSDEFVLENTDTMNMRCQYGYYGGDMTWIYAEVTPLDANGEEMSGSVFIDEIQTVQNTFSPAEMATAIEGDLMKIVPSGEEVYY